MDAWLKRKGKLKLASIENMIKWFKDREGKVTYSMNSRLGPNSYDCSSAVYFSLIAGGFLPSGTGIGNTDSLFALEGSLLTAVSRSSVKRGDIFVAGYKGSSGGAAGHTGVFLDNQNIIHCNYTKNGISTTPAEGWMGDYSGLPVYFYRLKGADKYPSTPFDKNVTVIKADWTRWADLDYGSKLGVTKLGSVYKAKSIFTAHGSKYYDLYSDGKFAGYLNVDGAKELKAVSAGDIYVSAKSPNYNIWGNFYFTEKKGNTSKFEDGLVYRAKYKYTLGDGVSYYSLYQKDEWMGYLNTNATMEVPAVSTDDIYVTAINATYNIWGDLYWKEKLGNTSKMSDGIVYKAKYKYTIGNGRTYYSLYRGDSWKGYINASAMRVMNAASFNKKVKINGGPNVYNIWKDFYWSTSAGKNTDAKFVGKVVTAKYSYLLGNDATYYSIYDGDTWIGYIRKGAVTVQ